MKTTTRLATVLVLATGCTGFVDEGERPLDSLGAELATGQPYAPVSVYNGQCFTLEAGGSKRLLLTPCTGTDAQRFTFEARAGGRYAMRSVGTGQCIAAEAGKGDEGTPLVAAPCRGDAAQEWSAEGLTCGGVELRAGHVDRCLDVANAAGDETQRVYLRACTGSLGQQVRVDPMWPASTNPPPKPAPGAPAWLAGAPAEAWSNPATWPGGVPRDGADVTIPRGKTVLLDRDVRLGKVTVEGTLACADRDLNVSARWIMLHGGRFVCGASESRYTKRLTITLTSSDPNENVMEMGTAFLGAMQGGSIELFGARRTSWGRLARTASAKHTSILLDRDVDWKKGDRLVLASTDFDPGQVEELTVSKVSGREVTLERPLEHLHWGELQTYRQGTRTWQLDERAEVGLLTRNIVIQGRPEANQDGLGGHVMSMVGSSMKLSNVELVRLGQKGRLGRYPAHWHLAGDVPGQFVVDSSIHHSFNRCVTIHGSNRARVANNVCHDHIGHGYFLENGTEVGNVIEGNLGLTTRKPDFPPIRPSDTGKRGNEALGPATFWLSHPDNVVRNNVAAGSDGSGFWYGFDVQNNAPTHPTRTPLKEFQGNVAHSSLGFSLILGAGDKGGVNYLPTRTAVFKDFTFFKTSARGIWAHGQDMRFENVVAADNHRATFFSFRSVLSNALIVGESKNVGEPVAREETAIGRSLPRMASQAIIGHTLYDGPAQLENVHFAGFGRASDSVHLVTTQGAAYKFMDHVTRGITFAPDTQHRFAPVWSEAGSHNGHLSALLDEDGTLTGKAGWSVVNRVPIMFHGACVDIAAEPSVKLCNNRYGSVRIVTSTKPNDVFPLIKVRRSDGVQVDLGATDRGKLWYQQPMLLDAGFDYRFDFGTMPQVVDLHMPSPRPGQGSVVLEIANASAAAGVFVLPNPSPKLGTKGAAVPRAASLAELRRSNTARWFQQGSSLFVKMSVGQGALKVCANAATCQ